MDAPKPFITKDEVLLYARQRGLQNPSIRREWHGLELYGEGRNDQGWSLCWDIAHELGIAWGCGNKYTHQIRGIIDG